MLRTRRLDFQLTCPRLGRASFSFFPVDGIRVNIQWDNLTHLNLQSMNINDSFVILRRTPRLVFCKVSGSYPEDREPSIVTPVHTPLRSLQLMSFNDDFLENLIAPHLEEFSLPEDCTPSIEVITSFIRRSACSLRSFSVVFSITQPYSEGLMSLLQSMPSLNSLSLFSINETLENTAYEGTDPRNIFQLVDKVLSSQSTSIQQGFLPNLKILEYTGELYLCPGNYDDLYCLPPADNAVHGPLCLIKLDLFPANRIPKKMITYVSSLEERGVTLNVLSDSDDILQSSIDYYRQREDSLCRDWADNLDLSLFS